MALIRFDSFDLYGGDTSDMMLRWDANTGSMALDSSVFRNGTHALRLYSTFADLDITRNLPASISTVTVGFGFRTDGLATSYDFLHLVDGSVVHLSLAFDANGAIRVYRGGVSGSSLATSANGVIATNTWYYIEVHAVIHDSTGAVEVKVNETTVLTLTGQDTRNGGNASVDKVRFLNKSQFYRFYFDDLYVTDTSGSDNTGFLGAVKVEARLPSGAGSSAQWTPSTGSNYANVDDTDPNGDTDYNSSATPAHIDTFAMTDLSSASGQVKGVGVVLLARKESSAPGIINGTLRVGSTNYHGANKSPTTSYDYYEDVWERNPDTNAAWTVSEVNGAEAGYRNNT